MQRSSMKFWLPRIGVVLLVATLVRTLSGAVVISEFMADNEGVLADEDGQFPDWIELHNEGGAPADLGGWFLTDNPLQPRRWAFPAVTLPADAYLVVFASGKNRTNNPARLHTSFQLDASGGFVALVAPDGATVASSFTYPRMKADISFGVADNLAVGSLLAASAPMLLVPAGAGDLPLDWNARQFAPG